MKAIPSDQEKLAVWEAYHQGRPTRVPVRWNVNPRIILLNPVLNPQGYDFESYSHDPRVMLAVQARFWEHVHTQLNRTCDGPMALPARWTFYLDTQNITDGAYFGDPVHYAPGQCPATHPQRTADDIGQFLDEDFPPPLENPWLKERLAFYEALKREAKNFTYLGRRGEVCPFVLGSDGPMTAGVTLMGESFVTLMALDPDPCRRFFDWVVDRSLERKRALQQYMGVKDDPQFLGLADDSVQMIGEQMFEDLVLASHRRWYVQNTAPKRLMHLCGNATRHFELIHRRLGVSSFDTGFPVDHGDLRRRLGPGVEISGGPRVDLLLKGLPGDCAQAAADILRSGIKQGGRFILQEGNNLPPCVPLENLAAVYEVARELGIYDSQLAGSGAGEASNGR